MIRHGPGTLWHALRTWARWLCLALCLLGGVVWGGAQAEQGTHRALREDAQCTHCHDEMDGNTLTIGQTRHGNRQDPRTPQGCTVCHGTSQAHLEFRGMGTPPLTDRPLSRPAEMTPAARSAVCLNCHRGGRQMHWDGGAHARQNIACQQCHTNHAPQDRVLAPKTQAEVCYTCHKQQRMEMNRPSHHPVPEGLMRCSDCHNVHGTTGEKLLQRGTTNATCFTCHPEKRGPFLHNHQPVVEDCALCHNPHGTTAESLLKQRQPFLCQQCHGTLGHPSNLPGTRLDMGGAISTNIGPGFTQARGCVNCHTQIHGSNSPSKATSGGAYRFFR